VPHSRENSENKETFYQSREQRQIIIKSTYMGKLNSNKQAVIAN